MLDEAPIESLRRTPDNAVVRFRCPTKAMLAAAAVALLPTTTSAWADGPFEPNESASQAAGPLLGAKVTAGLETPQDVDWFRFFAKPHRQVGVLATMPMPCPRPGSVHVNVYDAEGSIGLPLISLTLGYTGDPNPVTAANATMTTERGHRYLMRVTQSICQGVQYTLELAPDDDLSSSLDSTQACVDRKQAARVARGKLKVLRRAMRRAHGARRAELRRRGELQRQTARTADAAARVACARGALTGFPYE